MGGLLLFFAVTYTPPNLVELGDDYYYDEVERDMIYPKDDLKSQYSIPPIVECYDYNNRFIVAIQRSRWDKFELHYGNFNFGNHTAKEFDKLFLRDRKGIYYWIIDKETPAIYGPLIQDEFTSVCDNLKVPDEMVDKMLKARKEIN